MIKRLIWVGLLLFYSPLTLASGIRTVQVNDTKMQPIHLKMGKASVLRFAEKPKKVVIGNQNYYSIEFIENDLTIQPLGDVETNLFVYTPYHTYGFILRVCHSCRYDDLVYVKWKSKYKPTPKKKTKVKPRVGFTAIGISFTVDKSILVEVIKTMQDEARGLRFVDLQIKNGGKEKINIVSAKIIATRGGVPLSGQGYVIEKDVLKSGEISKARIFLPLKEKKGFTVNAVINEKKGKVIVGRKYLK